MVQVCHKSKAWLMHWIDLSRYGEFFSISVNWLKWRRSRLSCTTRGFDEEVRYQASLVRRPAQYFLSKTRCKEWENFNLSAHFGPSIVYANSNQIAHYICERGQEYESAETSQIYRSRSRRRDSKRNKPRCCIAWRYVVLKLELITTEIWKISMLLRACSSMIDAFSIWITGFWECPCAYDGNYPAVLKWLIHG